MRERSFSNKQMQEDPQDELFDKSPQIASVFRDPKFRFRKAIETLESYAKLAEPNSLHLFDLKIARGEGLKKFIYLAKDLFSSSLSSKLREQSAQQMQNVKSEVLKALEDVSRFHPVIRKKQTEDAKNLTQRALATLSCFTKEEEAKQGQDSVWHKRLLKFLIKRNQKEENIKNITFPLEANRLTQSLRVNDAGVIRLRSIFESRGITLPLSERETDAFRMKAISLLKKEPNLFPTIKEAMSAIRNTPIYTTSSPCEPENESLSTIINLEQKLSPFPGEIVILRGSFKRDPKSLAPSLPITDSFEMKRESVQSGFPAPSQSTGWSLADPLFPASPLMPIAPFLTDLNKKKEEIARAFTCRLEPLETARVIARKKSKAVRENTKEFLKAHCTLAKTLFNASSRTRPCKETIEAIDCYFSSLETAESPFDLLAELYLNVNQLFIEAPHAALIELWTAEKCPELYDANPKKRMKAAKEIALHELFLAAKKADHSLENGPQKNFGKRIGWMLGKASINIYLQYFSERLESPPPQLSEFEKKLQTAAIREQISFIKEIEKETEETSHHFETLKRSLTQHIELFQKEICDPFCAILENYYLSRF